MLVPRLRTRIVTPGSVPPDVSWIVPIIFPVLTWPHATELRQQTATAVNKTRFMIPPPYAVLGFCRRWVDARHLLDVPDGLCSVTNFGFVALSARLRAER